MKRRILKSLVAGAIVGMSVNVMAKNLVTFDEHKSADGSTACYAVDTDKVFFTDSGNIVNYRIKLMTNKEKGNGFVFAYEENKTQNKRHLVQSEILKNGDVTLVTPGNISDTEITKDSYFADAEKILSLVEAVKPVGGKVTNAVSVDVLSEPSQFGWVKTNYDGYEIDVRTMVVDKGTDDEADKVYFWARNEKGLSAWAIDLNNNLVTPIASSIISSGDLISWEFPYALWMPIESEKVMQKPMMEEARQTGSNLAKELKRVAAESGKRIK